MDRKDSELLKRLLPVFRAEAEDHLNAISAGLMEIENGDPRRLAEIVETVFRESHSLKGAARSVNMVDVVSLCQSMENVFSALKGKEITPSQKVLDLLHRAVDYASRLAAGEELSPSEELSKGELIHRLENAAKEKGAQVQDGVLERVPSDMGAGEQAEGEEHPPTESAPKARGSVPPELPTASASIQTGTVRVSTAKLDALLLQAEEMLSLKLAAAQRTDELKELEREFVRWRKAKGGSNLSIRGGESKGRASGKGDDAALFIASFETRLSSLIKSAEHDRRSLGARVDGLLYDAKKALMLPFSSLIEIFPRLVRDLSRAAGKDVKFLAEGENIEADRRVLEEIKDPLIHLVRNCVDHGIEVPEERKRKGKSPWGNIEIAISSRDGRIEIAVSDDGAGIDAAEVKSAAVRSGSIAQDKREAVSEEDPLLLIFRSGVTTSPIITDISGRGLGLAIVRERVEKLSGTVTVETQPGIGTTFKMAIPLTLATFRGILTSVGAHLFILPSANVERVARLRKESLQTVENREVLSLDGRVISVVRLRDVLGLRVGRNGAQAEDPFVQVVVLGSGEKRIAFLVDEILSELEVIVKNLGSQLSRVRNIAGATILGNGKVVPILNVSDLMTSAARLAPAPSGAPEEKSPKKASILVVEDSITARTLLKTILESAGYDVTTAVDGIDGLTALKARGYDLVISDVDMPRMNGFDLTAKIRADKNLSALPVVLVTALGSREDRERGIDVGANAYIVKSSFEQSNLLEVVRRFL